MGTKFLDPIDKFVIGANAVDIYNFFHTFNN